MALTVEEVDAILRLRDEMSAKLSTVQQSLGQTERASSSFMGTLTGFVGAQAIIGALSSAFSLVSGAAIGMNATLETSTLQFTTLMGNADAARQHVTDLFEIAKRTPFETGPIIEASRKLQTFGGAALNTRENIILLGDSAAATGAPIDQLGFWVGRLYSQLQGGQPFGEAAMRLQELAVLSPQARAQMEALQAAGASGDQVFASFKESLQRFTGAMETQAGTWQGVISTLRDTINLTGAALFRPLFESARDSIARVNELLGSGSVEAAIERMATGIGQAVQAFGRAFTIAAGHVRDVWNALGPVIERLATFVPKAREAASALASEVWTQIRGTVQELAGAFAELWAGLGSILTQIEPVLTAVGAQAWQVFAQTISTYAQVWALFWDAVLAVGRALAPVVEIIGKPVWSTAVAVWQALGAVITAAVDIVSLIVDGWRLLAEYVGLGNQKTTEMSATMWTLQAVLQGVASFIESLAARIKWVAESISELVSWVNFFRRDADEALPEVTDAFTDLSERGIQPVTQHVDEARTALSTIGSGLPGAVNAASSELQRLGNNATTSAQRVAEATVRYFSSTREQIAEQAKQVNDLLIWQGTVVERFDAQMQLAADRGLALFNMRLREQTQAMIAALGPLELLRVSREQVWGAGATDAIVSNVERHMGVLSQLGEAIRGLVTNTSQIMGSWQESLTSRLTGMFGSGGVMQSIIGGGLNMIFGPATGLISSLVSQGMQRMGQLVWAGLKRIGSFFRDLFGGPSAAELAGREVVAQFEQNISQMLTETQRIEAGGDAWKETVIVVRDAYIALGLSEEQALADVQRLWAASREGPEAARAAVELITQRMQGLGGAIEAVIDRIPSEITVAVNFDVNDPRYRDFPIEAAQIESAQRGGFVEETGLAYVHSGEQIVPATVVGRHGLTVNVPLFLDGHVLTEVIARRILH